MADLPTTVSPATLSPGSASTPRARVAGPRTRLARLVELLGLFLVVPLLLRWGVVGAPRLLVLALVTAGCAALLWRDPTFDRRKLTSRRGLGGSLGRTAVRGVLAAAVVLALVATLRPTAGALPTHRAAWLGGLALYPFVSAWPQELIFRVFFFHRYAVLLGAGRTLMAVNALSFGALHLVYPNAVAPLVSIPAGALLALTYQRTGSMSAVWIEHTVYGLLVFSLGLGGYFFDGRP